MKTFLKRILLGLLSAGAVATARADEVSATPPAGYFKLTAQGGSDTLLALPLVRRTAWMGRVTAVTSSQVSLATADVVADGAAAPSTAGWYYAEFVTGALAGLAYPVSSNEGGTFTLNTQGDDLTAHALGAVVAGEAGDVVRIRSGWSVAAVFGDAETLMLESSPAFTGNVYLSGDAVLIPDNETPGTEKKPSAVLAYVDGEGWRQRGVGESDDAGGLALLPGRPFTVRRGSSAPVQITLLGYVSTEPRVVRLPAVPAGDDWDFAVTWGQPVPRTLAASDLAAAIAASVDPLAPTDLVLDYAGFRRGFARPPEHAFTLLGGHWFEGEANQDEFLLTPAAGYLLRLRGERPVRYWRQNFSQ